MLNSWTWGTRTLRNVAKDLGNLPPLPSGLLVGVASRRFKNSVSWSIRKYNSIRPLHTIIHCAWPILFLSYLVSFAQEGVSLLQPICFSHLINWMVNPTTARDWLMCTMGFIAQSVLSLTMDFVVSLVNLYYQNAISIAIQSFIYDAISDGRLHESMLRKTEEHDEINLRSVILQDVRSAVQFPRSGSRYIRVPFRIAVSLAMVRRNLGTAELVAILTLVLLVSAGLWMFARYRRSLQRESTTLQRSRGNTISQIVRNITSIKAAGNEPAEAERIDSLLSEGMAARWRANAVNSAERAVAGMIPRLLQAYVGWRVSLKPDSNLGRGMASASYLGILMRNQESVRVMTNEYSSAQLAYKSLGDVFSLIQHGAVTNRNSCSPGTVCLNLMMSATDSDQGHIEQLTIKPGQRVAVIGPVGSGKSALLRILVTGDEYCGSSGSVAPGVIGYIEEHPWFFPGSIYQNVVCTPVQTPVDTLADARYREALRAAQLEDDVICGLDDHRHRSANDVGLSGGQIARVGLARALYSDAPVILLDNSFAQLDSVVGARAVDAVIFRKTAATIARGRTIFVATHSPRQASSCDILICLGPSGRVLAYGSPEELLMNQRGELIQSLGEKGVVDLSSYVASSRPLSPRPDISSLQMEVEHKRRGKEKDPDRSPVSNMETLKRILELLLGNWLLLSLSMAFTAVEKHFDTKYDTSVLNSFDSSNSGAARLLLVPLLTCAFRIAASLSYNAATQRNYVKSFRSSLSVVLHGTKQFFDDRGTEVANSLLTRNVDVAQGIFQAFRRISLQLLSIIPSLVSLLGADERLVISFLIPAGCWIFFVVRAFNSAKTKLKEARQVDFKAYLSYFTTSLQGAVTIGSFGAQDAFRDEFARRLDRKTTIDYFMSIADRTLQRSTNLCYLVIVAVVSLSVIYRSLPVAAVTFYELATALSSDTAVDTSFRGVASALVKSKRLARQTSTLISTLIQPQMEIMEYSQMLNELRSVEQEPEWRQEQSPDSVLESECLPGCVDAAMRLDSRLNLAVEPLVITDAHVTYPNSDREILHGVSLTIQPGEMLAVMGRTGAGKSTIANSILRLCELQSGSISFCGRSLTTLGLHDIRRSVALVSQDNTITANSIRTSFRKDTPEEKIWSVLEDLGVASVVRENGGLDECAPRMLSEGQRQLINISRALLGTPRLLILDEATAHLGGELETRTLSVIRSRATVPILSICHSLHAAEKCDRVAILDDGLIVEIGSPAELRQDEASRFATLLSAGASTSLQ